MIKILVVDDHSIVREGLRMILSLAPEIEVTAEAENGQRALELLTTQKVDVVLMDVKMPVMDGVVATKLIKQSFPETRVIILTTFNEDPYIFEGLKNGADGYLLKDSTPEEIIKGIKTVYSGNTVLQPEVATKVVKGLSNLKQEKNDGPINNDEIIIIDELTKRESEIAKLVAAGRSNKEIGGLLFISEGTVKNYISTILDKLNLRDRTQIAIYIRNKMERAGHGF